MDNILYLTETNIVNANKIEQLKETLRKREREIAKQNQTITQQKDEITTLLEVRNVVQIKPTAIRLGIFPIYSSSLRDQMLVILIQKRWRGIMARKQFFALIANVFKRYNIGQN